MTLLLAVVVDPAVVVGLLRSVGWTAVAAAWFATAVPVTLDHDLRSPAGYYDGGHRVVVVSRLDGPLLSHEAEHAFDDLRGPGRERRRLDLEQLVADPTSGPLAAQALRFDDLHYYHNLLAYLGGDPSGLPVYYRKTYYGFLEPRARYRVVLPALVR